VFLLGTQYLVDPAYKQAKKLIDKGMIGQPIHAECGYFRLGDWGERGMHIHNPNTKPGPDLNWEAFLGDSPKRPFDVSRFFRWRLYMDYSGGPSTDLYPHFMTQVIMMMGAKFPSKVTATGGIFRYQEREVPDTFDILITYPEKISMSILGTLANNYQGNWGYGGGRAPIIRGWEGTLIIQTGQIKYIPLGKGKKEVSIPLTEKRDQIDYWADFFKCVQARDKNTTSPADLACHVQTVLHMAMLGWQKDKVALFDVEKEKIIL
jgi:predicted dehydrogenase